MCTEVWPLLNSTLLSSYLGFQRGRWGRGKLCFYILLLNSNWVIIFYHLILPFINCKLFPSLTSWKINIVDHDSLFDSSICWKILSCGCNWLVDINIESKPSFLNVVCLWFVVMSLCHLLSIASSFSLTRLCFFLCWLVLFLVNISNLLLNLACR